MAQPATPDSGGKWGSFLSHLNPIPRFPGYSGPYKVGTIDVEIPISELDSPAPAPDDTSEIETIQFRVFYPCQPDAKGKRISWLPAPQREHLSAYMQFLGVGPLVANAASFLPRHLHYTSIPVHKNAPLLSPPDSVPHQRWPTTIFSHGLGGSRNAYSQLVGSLASHGAVVFCPEHRDGSPVISYVRVPGAAAQDRHPARDARRVVPYRRIPHDATDAVHEARNAQLRIRTWELGLLHDAVLGMDAGTAMPNLNRSTPREAVAQFRGRLQVREPGSITFAGHSFGATTMVQFLKSVFYAGRPELADMPAPLYAPARDAALCRQVTPRNVAVLLDMWCLPLLAPDTKALFDLPLPAYATGEAGAPGGDAVLAVESDDFYKWSDHLHVTARVLSPAPGAQSVAAVAFDTPAGVRLPQPHFFYVQRSAHLNQSDFGILFPWATRKIFGAETPERTLRLNGRAILQVLRKNGVPIARTGWSDLQDGAGAEGKSKLETQDASESSEGDDEAQVAKDEIFDDKAILDRGGIPGVDVWKWVDIIGMGRAASKETKTKTDAEAVEEKDHEMAGVMEPSAAK
ncbi:phospholipase A2 [Xylariaceae sp. FL0016]|nr:phospholipase A2 [Xylariaceae sp. FL0016]